MNALSKIVAAAAVAALLAGCASQYSRLEGTRYYRAAIDTYDVLITQVDGQSAPVMSPLQVKPGPHAITVQSLPNPTNPYRVERTLHLDVEPCTHYYLVAVKPSPLATDFEVKVDYAQPISGCMRPAGG